MKKRILNSLSLTVGPFLAYLIIRLLKFTMRITYVNFEGYRELLRKGNIVLAFWHGRLLMMPYSYPGKGITILVSSHRDGELITRTVKRFGIESVRGSSTRGWFAGIKGLLKSARDGRDIAITPDGPKGPAMKAQMGTIQIAKATGFSIIPMAFNASKKKPLGAGIPLLSPIPLAAASLYAPSL